MGGVSLDQRHRNGLARFVVEHTVKRLRAAIGSQLWMAGGRSIGCDADNLQLEPRVQLRCQRDLRTTVPTDFQIAALYVVGRAGQPEDPTGLKGRLRFVCHRGLTL
jgi:hypothetical protein